MKKYITRTSLAISTACLLLLGSCDLDINDNPNAPTASVVTPNFMLNATVAATAYTQVYNFGYTSASYIMGYQVPGDGISGFGDVYTYNFTTAFNTDAWYRSFEELRDYQTIIEKSDEEPTFAVYGAVARILKSYVYHTLVDAYGDVPYSEALQGHKGILLPKYDKDSEIYPKLVDELDNAISVLRSNIGVAGLLTFGGTTDPIFKGDLTKWIKFANNIKLRILTRARGSSIDAFVQSAFGKFSSEGFLLEDILVNPGYNSNSKENPMWETYHSSVAGGLTQPARYYVPSIYLFAFYDSTKLKDPVRGALTYKAYPNTPKGELGNEGNRPKGINAIWHVGTGDGINASTAQGLLKSRAAGYPLFTLAETHFLLAEAALFGHTLNGDAKTNFVKGIEANFNYMGIEGIATAPPADFNAAGKTQDYITANTDSYLANFDKASTNEQKLEAIITQKYIALNLINPFEAWAEFRRTKYPAISGTSPVTTFISSQSQSTRADKLPVRFMYPTAEVNGNVNNVPKEPNAFAHPVFWQNN